MHNCVRNVVSFFIFFRGDVMAEELKVQETMLEGLEKTVLKSCFCKLREFCPDKESDDCYQNRNIYKEFMAQQKN